MHSDPAQDRAMRSAIRRQGLNRQTARQAARPWAKLLDALLELTGGHGELVSHTERPWASATFAGSRHTVTLNFDGLEAITAAEQFIAVLPDHEFEIRGQLVADATITEANLAMLPQPKFAVVAELLLLEEA